MPETRIGCFAVVMLLGAAEWVVDDAGHTTFRLKE